MKKHLIPIQDCNSDSDFEDDIPLQIRMDWNQIDVGEENKYAENYAPYNASFLVAYVPENPDVGVDATYAKREEELKTMKNGKKMTAKERKQFTFSLYYGTSKQQKKVCGYLDGRSKEMSDGSNLIKLMKNEGQICWRKEFTFSGGTSEANKNAAVDWQRFYKRVRLFKEQVQQDPEKVTFNIMNGGEDSGLRRKNSYVGILKPEDKQKAKRIGIQNRPLLITSHTSTFATRPRTTTLDPTQTLYYSKEVNFV